MGNTTTTTTTATNIKTSKSFHDHSADTSIKQQKRSKLNLNFMKRSKTSGSISTDNAKFISVLDHNSNSNNSGCFKCNLLPSSINRSTELSLLNQQQQELEQQNGLFRKMRQRILNNLNRFSNPEPSNQCLNDSLNQRDQTNDVVRSQTDCNLNKLNSQTNSIQTSLNDLNKKKTKRFPKSPAILDMNSIQNDFNVRISDLLEDNESITSYDDFDNNQQINETYSSSSASSSSLTLTSNETLNANKQSSESLCYIDEIDSLIIQSSSKSTSNSSSSSASLTSLNQTTTITNLTICTNSNLPFLNKVNERLLNFVNTKQPDEIEMKQFIYYYDDLLDLDHYKQNDNISVYKSSNNKKKSTFNLNSRAPLASSETTTLSGSQTHLNSFTIIKRIKL